MRSKAKTAFPPPGEHFSLLVEIGCEEIPARFLSGAQKGFGARLGAALNEARLLPEGFAAESSVATYSTPRRLLGYLPKILARQRDLVEQITGPPVRVAFDGAGKPTRAAESFAEKVGVGVSELVRITTPKGEYLGARKATAGHPALELLSELLPEAITGLTFPKSMYWVAKSGPHFVRPIRWIVALLGEGKRAKVVPFEIAGVKSANTTYGHRALDPGAIRVTAFTDYAKKLRQARVEFDPARRHERVLEEIKVLLEGLNARVIKDRELEDWVVNSTEWPQAILGRFEERFLNLPREILVTVMRDHQKYFAVEDEKGSLLPRFITVLNQPLDPQGLIRVGHERVLAARFRDAEFFWKADQKVTLERRFELLKKVTYHEKLGSYADKVWRMLLVSDGIERLKVVEAERLEPLRRAVRLSKSDLTTQMVQEFPELQGIVGGLYAREQGEPEEVWRGIYDHYRPQGLEDPCPNTLTGAIVSLVDKFDTVLAGFRAGLIPTGSSDPFGLRRHAGGLIKLLLEVGLPINVARLEELAAGAYARLGPGAWAGGGELHARLEEFFGERLRYYLESVRGIRYDTVRAVMAAGFEVPLDALRRAEALEKVREGPDFEALSMAAKRIHNILVKSAGPDEVEIRPAALDPTLVEAGPEQRLFEAWERVARRVGESRRAGDYVSAFDAMSTLRPAVDAFFDKVLVMADEPRVRRNRLELLTLLNDLFRGIAHLSEIQERSSVPRSDVGASTSEATTTDRTSVA